MKKFYKLVCIKCKHVNNEKKDYTKCSSCGGGIDIVYDYEKITKRLNKYVLKNAPVSSLKYMPFYPLENLQEIITLHEGGTPFFRAKNLGKKLGMKNLFIKNESTNPTGAFKDRGSMIEITKAKQFGKKAIICASTGNMAASVSAYAANAKIPCYILTPEGIPIGKLSQTLSYGARVIQVRGTYDDAARLAAEIAKKNNFFLAGDYAFRVEGQKSESFEMIEQLGECPDKVIIPIGCGTNLTAIWKGFKEFKYFGFIDKLPKIIGVQAMGACPVITAFNKKKKVHTPVKKPETVAGAICIGDPLDGDKSLNALNESRGLGVIVSDEEILEAEKLLAREESLFVEPSAAAPLAALVKLLKQKKVKKDEKVVLVVTGNGLKDPISALKVLPSPPATEPNYSDVKKFLDYGFYNVYAVPDKSAQVIFKKFPTIIQLKNTIKRIFHLELNKDDLEYCLKKLKDFKTKGKVIRESDLNLILKNVLKQQTVKKKILKIVDFEIESGKYKKSKALIKLLYGKKEIDRIAEGVGPVDAVINAVTASLKDKKLKFKLLDYHVTIDSKGTDSVVSVKMTLIDEKQNKVIAVGTSPDIITASIEAFEKGYNMLYSKKKK